MCFLSVCGNVIISIPSIDKAPGDQRHIEGVVMNVNEHGSYKIGTRIGQIKGYMSWSQIKVSDGMKLNAVVVYNVECSSREVVSRGQWCFYCHCKKRSGNVEGGGVNAIRIK